MIIEKDKVLKCWIVWEIHHNYKIDRHHAKTKRECKTWLSSKNMEYKK